MTDRQPTGTDKRIITDTNAKGITRVEELAYDLKVSQVMTTDVKSLPPDAPVKEMVELFRQNRISGAPILVNGQLAGIVSMEDLIHALMNLDQQAPASQYMTPAQSIITIRDTDPVVEALELFTRTRLGRLPVMDQSGCLVGMITKGDITRGVLSALQKDYHAEELRRYRASHLFEDINSDRTSLILRYTIQARDFTHSGDASSNIKRALLRLGANPQLARRCGIAVYEAEMNLVIHTHNGGILRVQIEPNRILMRTTDDGPGIPNVELALQTGYSTASEEIRELGFGAGMGLANIKRCVDRMQIDSAPNRGTVLEMEIFLTHAEGFRETSYFDEERDS
jgi:CBS domain-containing protein/anti-sigma regulatory factor (Ser/Thr protein kinase)